MNVTDVDLVVLGGGSGGYAAAIRAAELGRTVVVVEVDKVGGTCLHRGCIPTKALLHAGEVADQVRHAASVGVRAGFDGIDVAALTAYRQGIVSKKYAGLQGLLRARGVSVVTGRGVIVGERTVEVDGAHYRGRDVLVATGAAPRTLPGIEVSGRIITSDGALALDEVPKRAIVLGGGVIGVEFASIWRSLGAEVTILEAADRLLPTEDATASTALERAFRRRGITTRLGAQVRGATSTAREVLVDVGDEQLSADVLLVAVGRTPVTDGLGLAEQGVRFDGAFVEVDAHGSTSAPGLWAVGDITRGPQLAHRGFQQGILAAETMAGLAPTPVPDHLIPRVTYSHPEVASVGLTESEARASHGDRIATFDYNLAGNGKSEIIGTGGVVKVIRLVDGPVIGVHMVGDRVGELITEAQLVVGWDAHPEDVAPFVHAHPTQSEALGEAFLALAGKALHAL